jgi:hypothetical protein
MARPAVLPETAFSILARDRCGHPLTIWVISNGGLSKPAVEEVTSSELCQMVDVLRRGQAAGNKNSAPKRNALSRQQKQWN